MKSPKSPQPPNAPPAKTAAPTGEQRRRYPRALTLALPEAKKPSLILGGRKFLVRNFSETGLGLSWNLSIPNPLRKGECLSAELHLSGKKYKIEVLVAHLAGRTVGLQMQGVAPELAQTLRKVLEPTILASSLVMHAPEDLEQTQSGYARMWLSNTKGIELVFWYQPPQNTLLALQLCFGGYWVYREQFKPTLTGVLQADTALRGIRIPPSELLLVDDKPKNALLSYAAQLLGSVPAPMPGYLLWQFLETGEQIYLTSRSLENQVA